MSFSFPANKKEQKEFLSSFSKSERYMAFLQTYLPRLASYSLYPRKTNLNYWRHSVYKAMLGYVADKKGLCLEFGVYKGLSINMAAKQYTDRKFYGFDSFEGFPEDGRKDWNQDFSVPGLPDVPENVELIKGWFSDTLPGFLEEHKEDVAFLNIDCDLYSSTHDVFSALAQYGKLKPGVAIFFDELINYNGFWRNEMLALFEMLEETGLGIDWIVCHYKVRDLEEMFTLALQGAAYNMADNKNLGYQQQAGLVLTDRGIDYSALALPHFRRHVKMLAAMYDTVDLT